MTADSLGLTNSIDAYIRKVSPTTTAAERMSNKNIRPMQTNPTKRLSHLLKNLKLGLKLRELTHETWNSEKLTIKNEPK